MPAPLNALSPFAHCSHFHRFGWIDSSARRVSSHITCFNDAGNLAALNWLIHLHGVRLHEGSLGQLLGKASGSQPRLGALQGFVHFFYFLGCSTDLTWLALRLSYVNVD